MFSCTECLSAEAEFAYPDEGLFLCEPCLERIVDNCLLDMLIEGDLELAADGRSFVATEQLRARRQ